MALRWPGRRPGTGGRRRLLEGAGRGGGSRTVSRDHRRGCRSAEPHRPGQSSTGTNSASAAWS